MVVEMTLQSYEFTIVPANNINAEGVKVRATGNTIRIAALAACLGSGVPRPFATNAQLVDGWGADDIG